MNFMTAIICFFFLALLCHVVHTTYKVYVGSIYQMYINHTDIILSFKKVILTKSILPNNNTVIATLDIFHKLLVNTTSQVAFSCVIVIQSFISYFVSCK